MEPPTVSTPHFGSASLMQLAPSSSTRTVLASTNESRKAKAHPPSTAADRIRSVLRCIGGTDSGPKLSEHWVLASRIARWEGKVTLFCRHGYTDRHLIQFGPFLPSHALDQHGHARMHISMASATKAQLCCLSAFYVLSYASREPVVEIKICLPLATLSYS